MFHYIGGREEKERGRERGREEGTEGERVGERKGGKRRDGEREVSIYGYIEKVKNFLIKDDM